MPAKSLEEVISSLSADEKTLLENTLSKNPELKDGWLRQDDYSRKQQELADQRRTLAEDLDYSTRMKAWADRAVPKADALKAAGVIDDEWNDLLSPAKAELEKQLTAARAAGGDMDEATLRKNVEAITKEYGVMKPEELNALIASEAKKLAESTFKEQWTARETDFNEKTIPFVAGFSSAVAVIASKYEKQSGKDWNADNAKELFALMTAEKNFDPYAVSEKFLKPISDAKEADEATKKAIADAIADDRKKRGDMRAETSDSFIPQPEQKGNIQKMLERSADGAGDFESLIRAQSVVAAKELVAEGK